MKPLRPKNMNKSKSKIPAKKDKKVEQELSVSPKKFNGGRK
jgi:hypothetical protein